MEWGGLRAKSQSLGALLRSLNITLEPGGMSKGLRWGGSVGLSTV